MGVTEPRRGSPVSFHDWFWAGFGLVLVGFLGISVLARIFSLDPALGVGESHHLVRKLGNANGLTFELRHAVFASPNATDDFVYVHRLKNFRSNTLFDIPNFRGCVRYRSTIRSYA